MNLMSEKIIYEDNFHNDKLVERTFYKKTRYVAGITDDEISRLNGDWAQYVESSGHDYIPFADLSVYSDEEKLSYGGHWEESESYYRVLLCDNEEIYSEYRENLAELIEFKLKDGKIWVKRGNNNLTEEDYESGDYSFSVRNLRGIGGYENDGIGPFDDTRWKVSCAIESYDEANTAINKKSYKILSKFKKFIKG